jgi:hypothetical protein
MSQQQLLIKVIQSLNKSGIQYMVTGSIASSLQGQPRSTHDIDLVIAIDKSKTQDLVQAFPSPDFYLEKNSILDAIKNQNMFNLIHLETGDKVDFWILTNEAFDQSRFSRKVTEDFMGTKLQVSTPEDTILAKLRWAKLSGGSEKQFTDALNIYEVQYGKLDLSYLQRWAEKLDVKSLWQRLTNEAQTE